MNEPGFRIQRLSGLGVEIVEADSDRSFARHIHEQFGIGQILQGAQRSASGRGQVQAQAGDLISLNPGEVHDGAPLGGNARRWRMLYFEPERITQAFADMASDGGPTPSELAYPVLRKRQASHAFAALYRAIAQPDMPAAQLAGEQTLPVLLAHLLEQRPGKPLAAGNGASRAKTLIDDDPMAPLTLSLLAEQAQLSRFQLVRAFSRLTGLTPHAYLLQRRLLKARQLVAAGLPLAEAAATAGFADQSHMSRHFVRCFGFTPGLYARPGR